MAQGEHSGSVIRRIASAIGQAMIMPPDLGLNEPPWLRLHQEAREALGMSLAAWAMVDDAAVIWFELARNQEGRRPSARRGES